MKTYKVTVIGAGNLAWSLIPALQKGGIKVIQLISRNASNLFRFQDSYGIQKVDTHLEDLDSSIDFVFLTVSDSAIGTLAGNLPKTQARVLHCSGSVSLISPQPNRFSRTGVFYPMQSFTTGLQADFSTIPIFLEASGGQAKDLLEIAERLSPSVYWLDSLQRRQIHLGAVWVNNFSNVIYQIVEGILPQTPELNFSIYLPLLEGQLRKLHQISPSEAQTGPAIRGDMTTIKQHLMLLEEHPPLQALYLQLSRLINPQLPQE